MKVSSTIAMIGVLTLCCSCRHNAEQVRSEPLLAGVPESDWLYLGIPVNEDYPGTRFNLDMNVPRDKYWRVTKLRHVSKEEYEQELAAGHMLFRSQFFGPLFYATELRGDFARKGDARYWVTILERKAYP